METLEQFQERKYDEQEHVLASKSVKGSELLLRAHHLGSKCQLSTNQQSK